MDQQQLCIWFAGFYEGEGTVSNDISNRNKLRVSISQNDRTPLDIGQKIWGGAVCERIRKSSASDKICKGHDWRLSNLQSLKFLEDIKPYMLIPYKINQIEKCKNKMNEVWERRFKCSFCNSDFSDISGRRRHEKINHIQNGVLHKCTICNKTYSSIDSMKRHVKLNHNSVVSVCEEQMQHTL